jgi:hypothetical protein
MIAAATNAIVIYTSYSGSPTSTRGQELNKLVKIGAVPAGYAAALVAASVAVYVRILNTQDAAAQASSGMYAFGDCLLFASVSGVLSLVPTALVLYYLRPFQRFWTVISCGALAVAVVGTATAIVMQTRHPDWLITMILFLVQILGAPLLGLAFLTFAAIAPSRSARWTLAASAGIEGAVSGYVFLCLFVLGHWL